MAEEKFNQGKVDGKKLAMRARIVQALFLGLFTLGLSMSVGDVSSVWEYPVSSMSITTTVFGLMGAIVCEIFARRAEKW